MAHNDDQLEFFGSTAQPGTDTLKSATDTLKSFRACDIEPYIAIDWGLRKGIWWTTDGKVAHQSTTLMEVLALPFMQRPRKVYIERTFASFSPDERATFIQGCVAAGHTLLGTSPRNTANLRRTKNLPTKTKKETRDAEDALLIWELALKPSRFRPIVWPPKPLDAEYISRCDAAVEALIDLRRRGLAAKCQIRDFVVYASQLGRVKYLPHPFSQALGHHPEPKEYSPHLVCAFAIAKRHCRSRREMQNMVGLHGNGHPSIFRSEIYYWDWECKREDYYSITLSEYQRSLRWLYHHIVLPPDFDRLLKMAGRSR